MANNSILIDISIKDDIDKAISSFESKLSKLEDIGDKSNLSKNFLDEINKIRDELSQIKKESQQVFSDMSIKKLDISEFQKFEEKVKDQFKAISQQFDSLNKNIEQLNTQVNSLDSSGVQNVISGWRVEFKNLSKEIENSINALSELLNLANKQGITTQITGASSAVKTLQKRESDYTSALNKLSSAHDGEKRVDKDISDDDLSKNIDAQIEKTKEAINRYKELIKISKDKNSGITIKREEIIDAIRLIADYDNELQKLIATFSSRQKDPNSFYDFFPDTGEIFEFIENLENELESKIKNTQKKIKEVSKSLGENIEENIEENTSISSDTFKVKGGKISIPIVIDENSSKKLLALSLETISYVQAKLNDESLTVSIKLVSGYKTKEREELLSQMQEQIGNINDEEVRKKLETLRSNIADKFLKDISINVHTNIGETEGKVKRALLEIKNAINKEDFHIPVKFKIDEDSQKKLQEKIEKLSNDLTFDLTDESKKIYNSLNGVLNNKKIDDWSGHFKEKLIEIGATVQEIKKYFDSFIIQSETTNIVKDTTKEKKQNKKAKNTDAIAEKDVDYVVKYKDYLDSLSKSLLKMIELKKEFNDFKNQKSTEALSIQSEIDNIKKIYPELEEVYNKLDTVGQTKKFIGGEDWQKFISTLPKTVEYLEQVKNGINDIKKANNAINEPQPQKKDAGQNKEKVQNEINKTKATIQIPVEPVIANINEFKNKITDKIGVVDIKVNPIISNDSNINATDSKSKNKKNDSQKSQTNNANDNSSTSQTINLEGQSFDNLKAKIDNVTNAINEKTSSIINEEKSTSNSINNEIKLFDSLASSIKFISEIFKSTENGINDNLINNLEGIYNALNNISTVNLKDLNFTKLTNFLKTISGKSEEDIMKFATKLLTIKTYLDKLNGITLQQFNTDSLNSLIDLVKKSPTENQSLKFINATSAIHTGFENLGKINIDTLKNPNHIISIIERILSKGKELENFANVLNKVKQVGSINVADNQRDVDDKIKGLNDAYGAYEEKFIKSFEKNGTGRVSGKIKTDVEDAKNALLELRKTVGLSVKQIKEIDNALSSVENKTNELQKLKPNLLNKIDSGLVNGNYVKQIENARKELNVFYLSSSDVENKLGDLKVAFDTMSDSNNSDNKRINAYIEYHKQLKNLYQFINTEKQKLSTDPIYKNIKILKDEINNNKNLFDSWNEKGISRQYPELLAQIKNDYNDVNEAIENGSILTDKQIEKLKEENKVLETTMKYQAGDTFLDKRFKYNNNLNFNESLDSVKNYLGQYLSSNYQTILKDISASDNVPSNGIKTLTARVRDYSGAVKDVAFAWNLASGNVSYHLKDAGNQLIGFAGVIDKVKKKTAELFTYWTSQLVNPMRIFGYIRQGIQIVQEYDDALVEMKKVSNETSDSLNEFQKSSYGVADSIGTTALQLQKSTADFLRIGYSLKQATEAASEANVLLNVSEFTSINDATDALISMKQAYSELGTREIIDELNIVGNNFAISTSELAQGMQNASAALKTQGNSFEEALALITAGNAIIQDVSKVSSGIRTISLRIASSEVAKKELEEIGEDTSDYVVRTTAKLQQKIKDLTKVGDKEGVNIVDPNGSLKSTYEILLDISKVYKQIQEQDKKTGNNNAQALVELLAGKTRSNIAASILLNPDVLEDVYKQASNAQGSAQKELNEYMNSITAKFTELKNQVHKFWTELISSDAVKTFVELETNVVKLINKFGQLKTVLVTISTLLTVKTFKKNGLNLFQVIPDNNGIKRIKLFGKSMKELVDSFKDAYNATGAISGKNGLLKGISSFFGGISNGIFGRNDGLTISKNYFNKLVDVRNKAEELINNSGMNIEDALNTAAVEKFGSQFQFSNKEMEHFIDTSSNTIVSVDGLKSSFKSATNIGTKFTNFLKTGASLLGNIAANFAISLAITGVAKLVSVIDDAIHSEERLSEKVRDIYNRYDELDTEYKKHKKTVDDISKRFEELSKGVDAAGNNISLTTDEFDEYHTITKQISDMFPDMVKGFDGQKNAIIDVTNGVNDLNEALAEEQRLANDVLINDSGNIIKDYKNKQEELTGGLFSVSRNGSNITADEYADIIENIYSIFNNEEYGGDSGKIAQAIKDMLADYNLSVEELADALSIVRDYYRELSDYEIYQKFNDYFVNEGLTNTIDLDSFTNNIRNSAKETLQKLQTLFNAAYQNADKSDLSPVAQTILGGIFGSINEDTINNALKNNINPTDFVVSMIGYFNNALSGENGEKLTNVFNELINGAFVVDGSVNDKYSANGAYWAMTDYKKSIISALTSGLTDENTINLITSAVDGLFETYGYNTVESAKRAADDTFNKIAEIFNMSQEEKGSSLFKLNELYDKYGINTEKEFIDFFGEIHKIVLDPENYGIGLDKAIDIWEKQMAEKLEGAKQSLKEFLSDDTNKSQIESYEKDMSRIDEAIDNFNNLDDSEKNSILNEFADKFPEITEDGELTIDMLYKLADAEWEQVDALFDGVEGAEKYREWLKKLRNEAKGVKRDLSGFNELIGKESGGDENKKKSRIKNTGNYSNTHKMMSVDLYNNGIDSTQALLFNNDNLIKATNSIDSLSLHFNSLNELLEDNRFKEAREEYENLVNVFANGKIDQDEIQSLMEIYEISTPEEVMERVPLIFEDIQMIMQAFVSGAGEVGENWWEQYQKGLERSSKGADQLFKELGNRFISAMNEGATKTDLKQMLEDEYSDIKPNSLKLSEVLENEDFKIALDTRDKINEAYKDGLSGEEITEFMSMFDMTSEQVQNNLPHILEFCNYVIDIFGEAGGEAAKEYIRRYTEEQENGEKDILTRYYELGNTTFTKDDGKNVTNKYTSAYYSRTASNAEKEAIIKYVDDIGGTFNEAYEHLGDVVKGGFDSLDKLFEDKIFSDALEEYEEISEILIDGIDSTESESLLKKYGYVPTADELEKTRQSALNIIDIWSAAAGKVGLAWNEAQKKIWGEKYKRSNQRTLLLGQLENLNVQDDVKSYLKGLTDSELSLMLKAGIDENATVNQLKEQLNLVKNELDANGILDVQINVGGNDTTVGSYYDETISKAKTLATVVNSLRQDRDKGGKYWSDIVEDEATFSQLLKIMPDLSEYMSQYSGDTEQTAAAIAYLEENGQRLYDEFVQNTTGLTELDGATDGARAAFEDMLIVLKQITGLDFKGELKDIGDSLDKIYFDGAGDQARSFADAVSDVESEIDTLKSAYNDLMSVDIKQDSQEFTNLVNTLIQQFPELIGHTDSIEELRNAVAQLLNEKSNNLVLRLIELRDTEGIPDELRGKINALIDSFTMLGNQPFSMDNTMNVLKSVRGELNQLAKFINEVNTTGLHLDMTASDEVYNLYPELLKNAKLYSDGTIELDREVYENFIKTKEAELKGDIDARVKELENQNTVLKSKIQYHEQRLNLAKKALATENLYDMEAAIEKIETADTLLEAEQANDAERVKSYNEASRIVAEDKKDLVNYQIEADNTELEHEQDTDIAEVESDDAKTINKMENDQTYAQHNTEMLMGMSENYAQEMTDEVEMSAEASETKQENEFAVANAAAGVGNDIVRMSGEASEKSQSNALTASEKIQNAAIWIGQKAALAAENWRKIGTNEGATNMGSAIMSGISGAFKTIGGWVQRAATTVSSAAKGELIQATKGEIKSFKDQFQGTFLTSIGDTISALKHSIDVAQVKQAKQDALKNIVAGNIDGVFEKALSISELKNDPSKINEFADSIKGRLESARETLQNGIESDEAIIADLYEQLAKNEYNIELLKANGGIDLQEMAKKLAADNAGKSGGSGSDHTPSGGSGGSGSDRDAADNANEFSEIIDWIEVKIKRLEEEIARLDKIAGNSFENYFDRAKAIEGNLDNVRKEIEVTRAAYYRYMMEANNIPLDENYRRLVREGAIAIEDIHDEELSNAIKAYTEWYDKAVEQQQKLYDLVQQVSDLYQSAFDLIQSRADSVLSSFQNASNLINSAISRIQERGYLVSEKYYEKLVDNAQTQIYILEKKHEEMLNMFQEAVDTGAIEEGSQAWYDYKNQVDQVTIAIDEMTNSIIQYNNAIRQLQWDKFDLTQGMVGELSSESDFLINLMSKYDMYSKEGFITNRGMSTKGLHGLNYNVYMQQADEYRREMLAVSRDLANDPNNQTLYNRRKELLELQREMILAAEQEKEALKSLVSDGIQKTLSYLQELISKYGEALDQQKSLYDYQKNIANQTKNITNLQKQLLSLGNDDSEETRKRVQELNNNLNTAQENLQETLYERAISDQKELLNGLYDDFNEILNTRLDNLDVLIAEQIGEINLASGQISDTINTVAGNVGYQITTGVGAVFESSNFNSLPALATYTTELMNELSNDRALITEELTKGQTSTLTNINENAAMIEGYLTGVAAALGYDGKTAASLIGDSVYGINLNAEKIDHISSLLGTGEGNIAENIHNAFSEDLSLLNSVFSGEDSLPNLIGAMVSTLEGAIGDSENNIFTKAFDSNTTIIQNEIQEVKDKVDKMDRFSDVIAAIDLGTGKVGDVITSMGSVNTTLTQIKEMMEKLFNVKATTPDSSKVTASSGSAAANGTGNYTKANVVAATGNGGSGKTGASTAVNAAKSGTKQGNGKPEVGDRVTFTGSYYFSAWQVRPVGNYLAGQPNAVEIDRDVSGYSGVSKPYHIKKAGTKPGEPWSDMGWVSLDQLKGYYLGTKSVDKDRFAIVNERGAETIVRPDGSILTPLSKKSMVVDAKATDNMWRMLKDPEKFMSSIFKDTNVISNNNGGNISNDINITIPINSVSDFADFMRQVQNSNEWERMFDAMLNNRLKGTSKFAKYNVNF